MRKNIRRLLNISLLTNNIKVPLTHIENMLLKWSSSFPITDRTPASACPLPGPGTAAAVGTADLTATPMGSSKDNRGREHGPCLNLPQDLRKVLHEVGVEYVPDRPSL
ncbi:hypothetical protein ILYODFUR_034702 [Ilyodon furcidens]|uniref:Uncharacterized protein n=1 Tax=Ilyodon furcidens TaxID=33524 RepID=A0ABV0TDM1_9TELE